MASKLGAAIARAVRGVASWEGVSVFLFGPRPNPDAAAAAAASQAAQAAEEANLRAAIGRAARRVVLEDILVLLRGPRPTPSAAFLAQIELLQEFGAVSKRGSTSRYSRRNTHSSGLQAIPLFLGGLGFLAFLEGYWTGQDGDEKPQE